MKHMVEDLIKNLRDLVKADPDNKGLSESLKLAEKSLSEERVREAQAEADRLQARADFKAIWGIG